MGAGEDYLEDFYAWVRDLSNDEFNELIQKFPEPEEWRGTYEGARNSK